MTEFQKALEAVHGISFQLDLIGHKLAQEPRTAYEAQNMYYCTTEELQALEKKLQDGSALHLKVQGFQQRAQETDVNKQIYGEAMKAKVQAMVVEFNEQRTRIGDLRMILEATNAVWEEKRMQEEEARRIAEEQAAARRQKELEEQQRLQALREEEQRREDLATYERLQKAEEERKRKEREKRKIKNEKRREREREERERLRQQEAEKAAAKRLAEIQLEEQMAVDALASSESGDIPKPLAAKAGVNDDQANGTEEVYTLQTLPEDLYTYVYEAHPIPKSPKAELIIVEPGSATSRCTRLVVWKAVLVACAPQPKGEVSFEYHADTSSAPQLPQPAEESEEEEGDESSSPIPEGAEEAAWEEGSDVVSDEEPTLDSSTQEPNVTALATFLAAQWEKKQEDTDTPTLYGRRMQIDWMSDPLRLQWLLLMSHGGYFAAAVYVNGKPVVHKTFHRYVCRRKQGGRQSTHDSGGGSMSSVGSQLRRHHEAKWKEKIQTTLVEWQAYIAPCSGIFLHAPGPLNTSVLYFDKGPLRRGDRRIQSIPFTTSRPSFDEIRRAYLLLSTIVMECR